MQMNLTKLATALILGSTLVGCAAVVKTPYQAPAVQVPNSFAYNNARSKQNQSKQIQADLYADQWWTLFGDSQLNQLVDQVIQRNACCIRTD